MTRIHRLTRECTCVVADKSLEHQHDRSHDGALIESYYPLPLFPSPPFIYGGILKLFKGDLWETLTTLGNDK
jgi:hypothetical protein